jgi:hypothetical protein
MSKRLLLLLAINTIFWTCAKDEEPLAEDCAGIAGGANAVTALYNSGSGLSASTNSGNYTSSSNLVLYLKMEQNLEDSANSYDFTGNNISSEYYGNTDYE